jgi:hypothetical protein
MPVADHGLLTYAELKTALDFPSDSQQALFEQFINSASAIANKITQRYLKAADYSVTLDGTGTARIVLPDYPINSVSRLAVDEARVFGPETEITNYGTYADKGILVLFEETFPRSPLCVQVDFNAGFTTVPDDIKAAVIEIVEFLESRRKNNLVGKKTINTDTGVSEAWELQIPLNARRILERYSK